jgi:hypothetical protein
MPDYSFHGGIDTNNANSQVDSTTGAVVYGTDQSTDVQLESTDPRYLENLYPGWKYDDATQQWYQVQVDTFTEQHVTAEATSDVAILGSEDVQQHQHQQQLSASTNAQLESTDPRYLESLYPGWKYDDATQQWYQVDTLTEQHTTTETTSAVASDDIQQQQQQQLSASYLQNSSHSESGLEPTEAITQPKPVTQADDQPMPAPHKEEEHEPTLAHPQVEPVVEHPEAATEAVLEAGPAVLHPETKSEVRETPASVDKPASTPESGSPGSHKGIHTAVKQVQWNDFGASTGAGGADPFGDLLPDGAQDNFFGATVPVDQGMQASVVGTNNVSTTDHSFSAGVDNNAAISAGLADSFYGGMDNNAVSQFDSSASAAGYGDQSTNAQLDSTDPKYLESLYPGWKYDAATQQWYQVDTPSAQSYVADNTGAVAVLGSEDQQQQQFNASYLQNSLHSALETIAEESSANATTWGAAPVEYPPNMLFYAEYPGWYFDTNTQQWQSLESYQQSVAQAATTPAASGGFAGAGHSLAPHTQDSYASSYGQQSQWQPGSLGNTMQPDVSGGNSLLCSSYGSNQQAENQIGRPANAESLQSSTNYKPHIDTFVPSTGQYTGSEGNQASYEGFKPFTGNQGWYKGSEHSTTQEVGYKAFASSTNFQTGHKVFQPPKDHQAGYMAYEPSGVGYGNSNGPQDFVPKESMYNTQTHAGSSARTYVPNNFGGTQRAMDFSQQQMIGTNDPSQQFGFSPHEQRSSAGRPPHAVVTFGFGGKLVVLKEMSSITANFGSGNQVQ